MVKVKRILILFVLLAALAPSVSAQIQVTAFSCTSSDALLLGDPTTCKATIKNNGNTYVSLEKVSLALDGSWAGSRTTYYATSFSPSRNITPSGSAEVTFEEIKPTVTGIKKFEKIEASPSLSSAYSPTATINVVAPVQVVTAIAPSSANAGDEFTVSATLTASGTLKNVSATLTKSGGCTLQTNATKFISELTSGTSQSLSWRLKQGSDTCSFKIDISASSGNSVFGISGSITGSVPTAGGGVVSPPGAAGGGGGGAASVVVEGFNNASASFMVDVVKELNLLYKQFYEVDRVLASVMAFTGEATGEYPAPVDHAKLGLKKPVTRLVGDVYELAAKQVLKKWVVARGVVIARGDLEVDGMAAVAYAKARGMPILLTKSRELPYATLDAIRQLGAKEIVIAGGPVAVSDGVEDGLAGVGSVSRVWGKNREETAVELAKGMEKTTVIKTIVVTDGSNAGIEAAIIAASYKAPIVYVAGDNVPAVTKDFLADHKRAKDAYANKMKVVFVGVSEKAQKEIEAVMK